WCIRYTPIVAVDATGCLILDISGCAHLWGGEAAYLQEIDRQLRQRGYELRSAIASTIGAAWAIARYGPSGAIVPEGGQEKAVSLLPVACLRLDANLFE